MRDPLLDAEQAADLAKRLLERLRVGAGEVSDRSVAEAGKPAASADAERQPMVDVIEEADSIVVIAEVPGASEADVTLSVDRDNRLRIATAPPLRYGRTVPLTAAVDAAKMSFSCRNGILEVSLPRVERGAA